MEIAVVVARLGPDIVFLGPDKHSAGVLRVAIPVAAVIFDDSPAAVVIATATARHEKTLRLRRRWSEPRFLRVKGPHRLADLLKDPGRRARAGLARAA